MAQSIPQRDNTRSYRHVLVMSSSPKPYGGLGVDQLKELKRLQHENERPRRAVSDLTLDKLILTETARGTV